MFPDASASLMCLWISRNTTHGILDQYDIKTPIRKQTMYSTLTLIHFKDASKSERLRETRFLNGATFADTWPRGAWWRNIVNSDKQTLHLKWWHETVPSGIHFFLRRYWFCSDIILGHNTAFGIENVEIDTCCRKALCVPYSRVNTLVFLFIVACQQQTLNDECGKSRVHTLGRPRLGTWAKRFQSEKKWWRPKFKVTRSGALQWLRNENSHTHLVVCLKFCP